MADTRRITRLALRQFKSIEQCELELSPLTLLVGRNGVGKSNIIDALRFTADALRTTLEFAIRERGGIDQVRRKSLGGRPTHPGIAIDMRLPNGASARYSFKIAAVQGRDFRVHREDCAVFEPSGQLRAGYRVDDTKLDWQSKAPSPAVVPDRLLLVAGSGIPDFRPVYDVLTRMTFHNLNPGVMKYPQRPAPGSLLDHDGQNLASVVKQLQVSDPDGLLRVQEYLQAVGVPISRIEHKQAGALETIEVAQELKVPEGRRNLNFDAIALSDGTIRALGILVSLVSARGASGTPGPSLIGIEEPETALHPAAAGALMEALTEGAEKSQIIVTCHSPDLLEHGSVTADMIRPVLLDNGRTVAGKLASAKARLLQDHLSTAGELLRLDQLEPDADDLRQQVEAKGTLWEGIL